MGELELIREYYRYDVPRAFVAKSKLLDKAFLVYWAEEFEDSDTWYYVSYSDIEQERVESGFIQLRDIFQSKSVLEIKTYFDTDTAPEVTVLQENEIDIEVLPPEGIAVRRVSENEYITEKRPIKSFSSSSDYHEIRLVHNESGTKKVVSWNSVREVFGAWESLYDSIVDSLELKKPAIQPALSGVGSFKMQFKATHNKQIMNVANKLFGELNKSENSLDSLKEFGIDLSSIESLIANLSTYNLQFEFRTNSGAVLSTINAEKLESISSSLNEYNQQRVGSESIPQADEISRIITLVEKRYSGQPFNSTTESLVERQISYYVSAAKMLGLIKLNGQLTPIGQKLAESSNDSDKAIILIELFERSVCGWAWLKFSNVESVFDLNRDSAVSFLLEKSSGLSENTAKRRAVTLRKWLDTFNAYKSEYKL
ncbi:MAG: hypothetical protein GY739_17645 [Mesoflavibacter sp.]|nr:hypothetical protein [Mesoflavibacter sp.]